MGEGVAERRQQWRKQNLCIMGEMQSNWFVRRRTEKVREGIRAEQEAVKVQRQQMQQEAGEQKQEVAVQRQQLRAAQAEFRAERKGLSGFEEMWCIGSKEEAVLEELAGSNSDLRRKVLAGGRVLYSYRQ